MDTMIRCFYGFANGKSEMQRNNIYTRLTSVKTKGKTYSGVLYEGKRFSYTEYIRQLVKESDDLQVVERDGKKEYRIMFPNHTMVQLNKTQYDFAVYLKENGFQDDAKAEAFYDQQQAEAIERAKKEKADEQAAAEKRIAYNIAKHEFEEKLQKWIDETESSNPYAVAVAMKTATDSGYNYNVRLLRALALMKHVDYMQESEATSQLYRNALRESLYMGNKTSRRLFQLYSGLKLPNTEKGTTEVLEQWYSSPKVMTDEELQAIPKPARTRRSSDTVAIMDILAENADSPKLKPALMKGRDGEWMLFNSTRIYTLSAPDPSIPTYEDEVMLKEGYRLVDQYSMNLYDPLDRDWSLKTIKSFMKEDEKANFKIDPNCYYWVNPLFLREALTILGDDVNTLFFRVNHMVVAKSDRGLALICMTSAASHN